MIFWDPFVFSESEPKSSNTGRSSPKLFSSSHSYTLTNVSVSTPRGWFQNNNEQMQSALWALPPSRDDITLLITMYMWQDMSMPSCHRTDQSTNPEPDPKPCSWNWPLVRQDIGRLFDVTSTIDDLHVGQSVGFLACQKFVSCLDVWVAPQLLNRKPSPPCLVLPLETS